MYFTSFFYHPLFKGLDFLFAHELFIKMILTIFDLDIDFCTFNVVNLKKYNSKLEVQVSCIQR